MQSAPKKVFISYSWTTSSHENLVLDLASRLRQDGVDIVLDKWDLREGQDKYTFMESMVNSPEIEKVLMILDKGYTEKANTRYGGVGTETMIITPQIYNNASQEKFIPVVFEVDENNKPFLPAFLSSRIYVDLSKQEKFEEGYESLLRNIYQRPIYSKPKIGSVPTYIFEETPVQYKCTFLVRSFDAQVEKQPLKINSILQDFLEEFYNNLIEFNLPENTARNENAIGEKYLNY